MLEQGPDFWCWFDKTPFSCHCVHAIHACKDVFNTNVTITFQSNCAEGLHFSAFHLYSRTFVSIYLINHVFHGIHISFLSYKNGNFSSPCGI